MNERNFTPLVEPLSAILPRVASLLKFPEVRPPLNPISGWYKVNLYYNYQRVVGHSMDNYFTLRGAIQDLIDQKVIIINTQEAASNSAPTSAPAPAPLVPHPNIVNQPLSEHSGSGGAGTSGVHSLFPSGPATSMVDPSLLIHHVSEAFPASLYYSAVVSSELVIHMIQLAAKQSALLRGPACNDRLNHPSVC